MHERLYFKQLLAGRDIGGGDMLARQMVNFVYLIGDREKKEVLVVDPAYDVAGILDIVDADDLTLTGVLATHYHPDHIGGDMMGYSIEGVRELLAARPVPIHVQGDEALGVRRLTGVEASDLVEHSGGEKIRVGEIPIELLHTPGHTPGSQCFYVDNNLVAGDTLFLEGCGRTDLPGGDPRALYHSLTKVLSKIPDDAILYPGHLYAPQPSASLGETRQLNYVFRPKTEEQWLMMFGQ
ncbi:MAG: putative polyketide biosynthesis zinc-dependent hydrolase BaeB [Acidimicrobiales bacterium]|nr:MAG: MBL fold metallo-hydrolase [Actinomycetota bacterium]MBV6510207.1 putative polyketide biosynthesis zinc-dependent hydrolase BaeB [Acidimicrobiales bacterium]RIK03533.1 MAG: MBL fold metallo-hydrolase [Acidobacteriota bacterium]